MENNRLDKPMAKLFPLPTEGTLASKLVNLQNVKDAFYEAFDELNGEQMYLNVKANTDCYFDIFMDRLDKNAKIRQ